VMAGPGYTLEIADRSWRAVIIAIIHRAAQCPLRQPCFLFAFKTGCGMNGCEIPEEVLV